jgi:hypothetical protein
MLYDAVSYGGVATKTDGKHKEERRRRGQDARGARRRWSIADIGGSTVVDRCVK